MPKRILFLYLVIPIINICLISELNKFYAQALKNNSKESFFYDQEKKLFLTPFHNIYQKEIVQKALQSEFWDSAFMVNSSIAIQTVSNKNFFDGIKILHRNLQYVEDNLILLDKIICYTDLAYAYFINNQIDSSLFYSNLSITEASKQKNQTLQMLLLNFQADMLISDQKLVEGISKKLKVAQLAKSYNDFWMRQLVYKDISLLSLIIGNTQQAYQYAIQAEIFCENLKDEDGLNTIQKQKELIELKDKGNESLNVDSKSEEYLFNENDIVSAWISSEQLLLNGTYKVLIERLTDFLTTDHIDKYNINPILVRILAESYDRLGKKEKALELYIESNKTWSHNIKENKTRIEHICAIFEAQGKHEMAIKMYASFLKNIDENQFIRNSKIIENLTEANLREEQEEKIEQQRVDIEKETLEKNRIAYESERKIIIVIVSLLIMSLGVGILLLRIRAIKSKKKQKEAELSQALLRSQMNPHFVFNAMSVIQSYIYENDVEKSSTFLVNFSRLMRLILENSPKELIPLELEREILEKYIIAQKMRFQDRFDYELKFDSELIENRAMIPPLITQPFIENAIEHGQLHAVQGGKIVVMVNVFENQLLLEVEDNGVGRKASNSTKKIKEHKSMAINITKGRIEILNQKYKSKSSIEIVDINDKNNTGTKVIIKLPMVFE